MNINDYDFSFIAKKGTLKINFHNFEKKIEKHLQNVATLLEKVKIFFYDILGGRLVKVSWEVILKIC